MVWEFCYIISVHGWWNYTWLLAPVARSRGDFLLLQSLHVAGWTYIYSLLYCLYFRWRPILLLSVPWKPWRMVLSYLSARHSAVAGRSSWMADYVGKKMLMPEVRRTQLRCSSVLFTVTAGAASGDDLTMERRTNRLVGLLQNLFATWSLLSL